MVIQFTLLVLLGFLLASFFFILIAPSFWRRAERLTRKRMEATMPLTLAEIEAEKDQLRASYAVKLRKLEGALNKAREKSAHQRDAGARARRAPQRRRRV
jgi:competence protein ComGC